MLAQYFFKHHFGFWLEDGMEMTISVPRIVEFAEKYADHCEKSRWISVDERLPEFETDVLVLRPNKFSGKIDTLIAYLSEGKPEGQRFGRFGEGGITFDSYWVLPAVVLLNTITHWQPLPSPPKSI